MLAQTNVEHLPLADNSIDLVFCDPPYACQYLPCYGWLAREAAARDDAQPAGNGGHPVPGGDVRRGSEQVTIPVPPCPCLS